MLKFSAAYPAVTMTNDMLLILLWSIYSHVRCKLHTIHRTELIPHTLVFVLFMIRREMEHFIHMRHQFLISKSHSRLPQARTVLITSVPEELANDHDLRMFASFVPGGVDRVWIYRDTKVSVAIHCKISLWSQRFPL